MRGGVRYIEGERKRGEKEGRRKREREVGREGEREIEDGEMGIETMNYTDMQGRKK